MAIAGNLSGILTPFQEDNPINLLSMIAQAGTQQPEVLAQLLAKMGAQVPTNIPAAGPGVGALAQQAQGIGPVAAAPPAFAGGGPGIASLIGGGPASIPPAPLPPTLGGSAGDFAGVFAPPTAPIPGGSAGDLGAPDLAPSIVGGGGGPLESGGAISADIGGADGFESFIKAIQGIKKPEAPRVAPAPNAIRPSPGGSIDPKLLEQLFKLLQGGGGGQNIPSLGALIQGKGGGGTSPQLTL